MQEERGFPDINIITEKVAFQGITRFEDRGRMPMGSVFNVTSFSARILSQAIYNPKACRLYNPQLACVLAAAPFFMSCSDGFCMPGLERLIACLQAVMAYNEFGKDTEMMVQVLYPSCNLFFATRKCGCFS